MFNYKIFVLDCRTTTYSTRTLEFNTIKIQKPTLHNILRLFHQPPIITNYIFLTFASALSVFKMAISEKTSFTPVWAKCRTNSNFLDVNSQVPRYVMPFRSPCTQFRIAGRSSSFVYIYIKAAQSFAK